MTKDNMDVISITPGQTVKTEHYRLSDGGLEANVQDEFDHRIECLMTPQVVNRPISTDSDWGLSGWTPGDSLEVTTSAGDILCDQGVAHVGGRRYIRTGSGSIKAEVGNPADATYYIRIKYVVSTDTHSFIAEAAESAETNDNKYLTLAQATWTDPNWTAEVDLRSSNTSLNPPVTFSGDTDADVAAVLTVTQTGSTEQSFEVYGGDIQFFTSGSPFKQVIYGNDTTALKIFSGATFFGTLRGDSTANGLVTDGDHTITGSLTGNTVTSTGVITAPTSTDTINGIVINAGVISSSEWQGTVIAKAYLAAHDHTAAGEGGDYPWADITGFGTSGAATEVSRDDHAHSEHYTKTEQQDWDSRIHAIHWYGEGTVTEDTIFGRPCIKFASLSTDHAYFVFHLPDNWSGTGKFYIQSYVATSWSGSSEYYGYVSGYSLGETLSATWNLKSGLIGTETGGNANEVDEGPMITNIAFGAGDTVLVKIGGFDGVNNDQIFYLLNAWIAK